MDGTTSWSGPHEVALDPRRARSSVPDRTVPPSGLSHGDRMLSIVLGVSFAGSRSGASVRASDDRPRWDARVFLTPSSLPASTGSVFFSDPGVHEYRDAIYASGHNYFDGLHGVFSREGFLIPQAAFHHQMPPITKHQPQWIDPVPRAAVSGDRPRHLRRPAASAIRPLHHRVHLAPVGASAHPPRREAAGEERPGDRRSLRHPVGAGAVRTAGADAGRFHPAAHLLRGPGTRGADTRRSSRIVTPARPSPPSATASATAPSSDRRSVASCAARTSTSRAPV